ncbi:MAG: hypothetical protein R3F43_29420 [bacterium]
MAGMGLAMMLIGGVALGAGGDGSVNPLRLVGVLVGFSGLFQLLPGLLLVIRGREAGMWSWWGRPSRPSAAPSPAAA